jgi:rhodanese-related sulfurtransferase
VAARGRYRLRPRVLACAAGLAMLLLGAAVPAGADGQAPDRGRACLDPALFVSAGQVDALRAGKPGLAIADLRPRDAFRKVRIPGSMNLRPSFVKAKTFLKGAPLILAGPGWKPKAMQRLCLRLRRAGFDATVLRGGICAWQEAGLPLAGGAPAALDLRMMSARALHREMGCPHWVVLDASAERSGPAEAHLPGSVHLPLARGVDAQDIVAIRSLRECGTLECEAGEDSNPVPRTIAVCTRGGAGYRAIAARLSHEGVRGVFFLRGGIQAYARYVRGLSRMRRPGESGRTVRALTRTGAGPEGPVRTGGDSCSGCW